MRDCMQFDDAICRYAMCAQGMREMRQLTRAINYILEFYLTDDRNRSRFFSGLNACPLLFPIFLVLPILLLPFTSFSPTKPQQRYNRTFNILLKATGGSERIPDDLFEDTPVKRAGIGIVISTSSTSLLYTITHTAKTMRCDIQSLKIMCLSKSQFGTEHWIK